VQIKAELRKRLGQRQSRRIHFRGGFEVFDDFLGENAEF
jgi:hypothetical protein